MFQGDFGKAHLRSCARDFASLSSPGDGNVKGCFDLTYVFVKRTTQISQALVVGRY